MPDQTLSPRPRPPRLIATLYELDQAHARVATVTGGDVQAIFGDTGVSITFAGKPVNVRQLLTDALAHLDAIETVQ